MTDDTKPKPAAADQHQELDDGTPQAHEPLDVALDTPGAGTPRTGTPRIDTPRTDAEETDDKGTKGDSGAAAINGAAATPTTKETAPQATTSSTTVSGNPGTAASSAAPTGLTPEESAHFDMLRLEYEGLKQNLTASPPLNPPVQPPASVQTTAQAIVERADSNRASLTREMLYLFERCLMRFRTLDDLHGKAKLWQAQLLRQEDSRALKKKIAGMQDPDTISDLPRLWDNLDFLLSEVARLDPCNPDIARKRLRQLRNGITLWTVGLTALVFLLCTLWAFIATSRDWTYPTVILTIACGGVGGLISMLRRLQGFLAGDQPVAVYAALQDGSVSVALSPVYGCVFALVIYLMFMGGLLKGAVFPTFAEVPPAGIARVTGQTPGQSAATPAETATGATPTGTAGQAAPRATPNPSPTTGAGVIVTVRGTPVAGAAGVSVTSGHTLATPTTLPLPSPAPTAALTAAPTAQSLRPVTPHKAAKTVTAKTATAGDAMGQPKPILGLPKPIPGLPKPTPLPHQRREAALQAGVKQGLVDYFLTWLLKRTGPVSTEDLAKLLIWAFIAGFAESWIPDTLTRLAASGGLGSTSGNNTSNSSNNPTGTASGAGRP